MPAQRDARGRFISAVQQASAANPPGTRLNAAGKLIDARGRFVSAGSGLPNGAVGGGSGTIVAGPASLRFYPEALSALLRGPNGPVYRMLIIRAEQVKVEAQRLVGVFHGDTTYRKRRPGTLRDSIVKRPVLLDGDPAFFVTALDPIAMWHHEGTEPHVIRPVSKPKLVFYWPKVGKVVAFTEVHHPGTKPNRFLVDALRVLR